MDSKLIVNIISSIIIWGAVAVIALRVLTKSGLSMPQNKLTSFILSDDHKLKNSYTPTTKDIAAVFGLAFAFRVIIFLFSIIIMYMFNTDIDGWDGIMEQYIKWDANNYIRIATGGYTYHTENNGRDFTTLAFFPLYSWIMYVLNFIFRDLRLTGLITSFLLYAGACCWLFKLFSIDHGKSTAVRAIVFMSVFPHALFFGTIMNESMLLFTAAATLYYIRRHNWVLAGIFGALAALSRMAGILCAVPAAVEWLEEYKIFEKLKNKRIKDVWKLFYTKGAWIFLMLAGTGIYLLCNYKVTGDPFKFLEYQDRIWNNGSQYFGSGIALIFGRVMTETGANRYAMWIPEFVSIIFVTALLVYGLRRSRNMYSAFLAVYIIINVGFKWPISVARYMTCAIPAFLFLSDFAERHKWAESLITASMAVGMGIYLVAYMTNKQVL